MLREIEGGLKNPSQTIMQSLAGALRLSAETLYLQAGVLDPRELDESDAVRELRRDPHLTEHQRETVVEVYKAFRRANLGARSEAAPQPVVGSSGAAASCRAAARTSRLPAADYGPLNGFATNPLQPASLAADARC